MKRFLISLILILIPLQLGFLYLKAPPESLESVAGVSVSNTASIGEYRFNLYGYTSPLAVVTFEGMGIFDVTTADDQGYFQFNNRFSPYSSREACLSSKDQFGRLSSPVCLPPFPVDYNVTIGPVIISPTVSLNKTDFFLGDRVVLSGQAIPNSEVNLAIFNENGGEYSFPSFSFIKPVEAFTFPKITSKSDNMGNFSINLPSSSPEKYRLFAQVNYIKSISPNSVRLNLEILPIWMIILKFFQFIFSLLRPRLLEIAITLEILYILWVLRGHFQERAIILYQNHLPAIEENHLPEIKEEQSVVLITNNQ